MIRVVLIGAGALASVMASVIVIAAVIVGGRADSRGERRGG